MILRLFYLLLSGSLMMTGKSYADASRELCLSHKETTVCIRPNPKKWQLESAVKAYSGTNNFFVGFPDKKYSLFIGEYSDSTSTLHGHHGDLDAPLMSMTIFEKMAMYLKYVMGDSGLISQNKVVVDDTVWFEVWDEGHGEIYLDAHLLLHDSSFDIALSRVELSESGAIFERGFTYDEKEDAERILKDLMADIMVNGTGLATRIETEDQG